MSISDSYTVNPGWGVLMTDLGIAPGQTFINEGRAEFLCLIRVFFPSTIAVEQGSDIFSK